MSEPDDHELLAEFARGGSDAAFATLTARYVNLVYSAALRFTGNAHHAEEITQAVFIILAKKAAGLRRGVVLGGWLYQTARLTAANFVKSEIRRQRREQEAYMQSTLDGPDAAAWKQIAPLLDEAMGQLGETDRNAVVLRYFEDKTAAQAAATLKLTEAAAHKRVNRALEKLRKIFTKRGVTLSVAGIAGAVTAGSVQAAPGGLATTVAVTAAKGTTISTTLTMLVKGTMKSMTWLKFKFAAGVGMAMLVAGGVATVAISQTGGDDQSSAQAIAKKSSDAYAALSSYSDSGTILSTVGNQTITTTFTIRLQRPDLYRIEWSQATGFFTNSGTVWSAGDGNFLATQRGPTANKPQKCKDMQTALAAATGISGQASATIPGTFFRQSWGDVLKTAASGRAQLTKQNDETVGGVDCYVVSSSIDPASLPNGGVLPHNNGKMGKTTTTLLIGKQDYLIHQTRTLMEGTTINLPRQSDAQIQAMLERQNRPATPEAIAAMRAEMEKAMAQAQSTLSSGNYAFTQTHENIAVNPALTPTDFAPPGGTGN